MDLDDFVACYQPGECHTRKQTWSPENQEGRWRAFEYDELAKRDTPADHASGCHLSWEVEVGMDTTQRFKAQIERLLAKGGAVLETHSPNAPGVIGFPTLDHGAFTEWRAQSLSLLTNLLGAEHVYVTNFEREVDRGYTNSAKAGIGRVNAILS